MNSASVSPVRSLIATLSDRISDVRAGLDRILESMEAGAMEAEVRLGVECLREAMGHLEEALRIDTEAMNRHPERDY